MADGGPSHTQPIKAIRVTGTSGPRAPVPAACDGSVSWLDRDRRL